MGMEKEIAQFALGIKLSLTDNGEIVPRFSTAEKNMPKEMLISQLRALVRLLEEEYYPDFKNSINKINFGPS